MKRTLLLLFMLPCCLSFGQLYLDEFDDGKQDNTWYAGNGFTSTEEGGEWTVNGDGTGGPFDPFGYQFVDEDGTPIAIDITENHKIFVRVAGSNLGTQLRMDVKDADGFVSTMPGIVKTLITDYTVLEFNFEGNLVDGGYGGTACDTGPCDVDGKRIVELNFFVNPGQPGWSGTVKLDFISVGEEPQVGPMSDVFQDQFDNAVSANYLGSSTAGFVNVIAEGQWKIQGDGTNGMWEPVNMLFYNTTTLDTTDVSMSAGDDKLYVRMRTDVPGTSIRIDIQDINDFASTAGSITKVISDEWTTYEFNYAGSYQDLAFGGTGCTVGPCDLDAERIQNMIFFVNPGVEGFVGEVQIDYISVGTALEPEDPSNNVLVYGDHFSQDFGMVTTTGAYGLDISDSELTINGAGIDAPFSSIAITPHDEGAPIVVDATLNNKVFLRVKSDAANTLLRLDLVDTSGFVTSQPSFTKLLSDEYTVLEFDFTASYIDGGFGGTPCEAGPCEVNGAAISTILLYPNAVDGGFEGNITLDYISFGSPMGEDVVGYDDHFDNEDRSNFSDAGGFTVTETGTELIIEGDGTAGPYAAFNYSTQDENGEPLILDITSNNKIYVKVKSSVAGTPLRIDVQDEAGFTTTNPSVARTMTEEYSILEFDFTGTYTDGGFGGTACDVGPCPVDGTTIANWLFYIDPDNGGYAGTVTIDWVSLFEPLEPIIDEGGPLGVDDYSDQFDEASLDFIQGAAGLELNADGTFLTVSGDGTSDMWTPIQYGMHEGSDSIIVNAESNEGKFYIRLRSSVDELPVRVDLVDNKGFHTSLAGLTQNAGTDFTVLEYDFTGNYTDGGYGGTACEVGPCEVDGKRVESITLYVNPGVGEFDGLLEIDWIAFGEPLSTKVVDINLAEGGKIYPNPVHDMMYLELDMKSSGKLKAIITDLSGRIVQNAYLGNAVLGNNSASIATDNMAQGMYLLTITLDNKPVFVNKIVKQ